jgi:hypothetical protein
LPGNWKEGKACAEIKVSLLLTRTITVDVSPTVIMEGRPSTRVNVVFGKGAAAVSTLAINMDRASAKKSRFIRVS